MTTQTPDETRPVAPYESVLLKAFDKLTSQILVFLLAYFVLVIGMGVLAPNLTERVRALLYALPVLGVVAHLWRRQRSLTRDAQRRGIDVAAGMVTGDARVTGVRAASHAAGSPEQVQVRVGLASGSGVVEGASIGDDSADGQAADARYLLATFEQLSPIQRRKLIASAQQLLDDRQS